MVEFYDPIKKDMITYFMYPRLQHSLDKVKHSLEKKDEDFVLLIDGAEGAGKSTLAFQVGKYVDPTLVLDRVCFSGPQFRESIFNATKGQCVIFDEAFTGLSSRSSLSEINRMLVSLMMQMRQKNLFVIIVLPTLFLLDKYVALWRTRALLHVYKSKKGDKGFFLGFNNLKKKWLYLTGNKMYVYNKVRTDFKGRFYTKFALGNKEEEELYKKKKATALEETHIQPKETRVMTQRNNLILEMHKEGKSVVDIARITGLKRAMIYRILPSRFQIHSTRAENGQK